MFLLLVPLPVLSDETVISSPNIWWKWNWSNIECQILCLKNYTLGKWGLREAFNQNSLMQLFNGDRRIVQWIIAMHWVFLSFLAVRAAQYLHRSQTKNIRKKGRVEFCQIFHPKILVHNYLQSTILTFKLKFYLEDGLVKLRYFEFFSWPGLYFHPAKDRCWRWPSSTFFPFAVILVKLSAPK